MQSLLDLLKPEYIRIGIQAEDAHQAILKTNAALAAGGATSEEYGEDAWKREQAFPTGLPTQPIAVAIPHADPDHVYHSAVGIGILETPVVFSQMGLDASTRLHAHIIFLLAVKEREKQAALIQQVATLLQTGDLLEHLADAASQKEAFQLIKNTLHANGSC